MACALIRACVPRDDRLIISELKSIISLGPVPANYNASVLQRGRLGWLFLFARHFCNGIEDR